MWPRLDTSGPAPRWGEAAEGTEQRMTDETRPAPQTETTAAVETSAPAGTSAPDAPGAPPPVTDDAAAPDAAQAPEEPRLSFDDFMKLTLRVATVVAAEPIPKSKKLLKVTVDLGTEQRTVVAGIARAYAPDALVGRTVVVVANLEKAKLMGVESNGMILAATDPDMNPVLLTLDDPEKAPPGSRVR